HDDVWRERDQFGCILAHGFGITGTPAIVDANILPDRPTRLLQGLCESRQPGVPFRIVRGIRREDAYAPHALTRLPACRERPRCRAAEQRDEVAPSCMSRKEHCEG